jgi:hypothetical protein
LLLFANALQQWLTSLVPTNVQPVCPSRLFQFELVVNAIVGPNQLVLRSMLLELVAWELSQRTHLTVDVGVPQKQLLALDVAKLRINPIEAELVLRNGHEPPLISRELLEERGLQVQIGPTRAEEFHSLPEPPAVLLHHVCRQDAA